ncbi:MAG: hypothetical protein F4145_03910 [Boseongicola sp. SB0675_bin_26]|nr:hypothetical protein [Boseongicola sp. SB0675_bin_26]
MVRSPLAKLIYDCEPKPDDPAGPFGVAWAIQRLDGALWATKIERIGSEVEKLEGPRPVPVCAFQKVVQHLQRGEKPDKRYRDRQIYLEIESLVLEDAEENRTRARELVADWHCLSLEAVRHAERNGEKAKVASQDMRNLAIGIHQEKERRERRETLNEARQREDYEGRPWRLPGRKV